MKHKLFVLHFVSVSFIGSVFAQPGSKRFISDNNTKIYEAEVTSPVAGTVRVAANSASGGLAMSLTCPGDGLTLKMVRAVQKLAIRYSSSGVGLIMELHWVK